MTWIDAGPHGTLPDGGMREIAAGSRALRRTTLPGTIHAVGAICPHHAAWLSEGRISGAAIDCPRHMGRFDIATGAQLRGPPCPALPAYKVRIVAGRIEVEI